MDLVELAQQLLAVETAIDPVLARRIVGLALNREPQSLPDPLSPGDLRPGDEIEVADRKIASADFVVVDLETTGLDVNGASILEIGAVRLSRLRIVDRFETLLRPPGKLPRAIVALTGIHDAMVAEAPTERRALRSFASLARSNAHGALRRPQCVLRSPVRQPRPRFVWTSPLSRSGAVYPKTRAPVDPRTRPLQPGSAVCSLRRLQSRAAPSPG